MRTFAIAFVRTVTPIASRTAGSRRSSGTWRRGTSVNSATSGSARNVSATPAASARRTVNPRPPGVAFAISSPRRDAEPEAREDGAPARGQHAPHEAVGAGGVGAPPTHDAHLVAHWRLRPPRQVDARRARGCRLPVAEVREAGVGRPEADLRHDAADVRLEADGVRSEDRAEPHAPQELARVGADRYAGRADGEPVATGAQPVHRAQAGGVVARRDEHEHVRRERDGPRALARAEQRLRLGRARGREQVGGRAALDLELELVRAGE